ncbi:MAG: hypothetical protein ABIN91_02290 [Mucilaginibacter sp.]|uniref:hypothetical protein n=1 Tax=Mucilaginibacter sp. TaxID=1882438 RepID=UPI003267190E
MIEDKLEKKDWNRTAKKWILACKIIITALVFCIIVLLTYDNMPLPYSLFIVGIELAASVMAIFMFVKTSNTPSRRHRKA